MKIFFIGTVEFSRQSLEKLIAINAHIVGVYTKKASSFNSDYADLAPLCLQHGIPYRQGDNINTEESLEWIRSFTPDIIFCFGWSSLLKKPLLDLAPMGVVGYHPAALPHNRGRHPIIWALALGLTQSASTFFFMTEEADAGDIISQEFFDIDYTDDASSLYKKISCLALRQMEMFVPALQKGLYDRLPQHTIPSNTWRKRGERDGLIDFRMSTRAIYNLVRALTKPYVGAHIVYQGQPVSIWKVEEHTDLRHNLEPGKILSVDETGITVKTYDGAVKILEHDFRQKPTVGEYL